MLGRLKGVLGRLLPRARWLRGLRIRLGLRAQIAMLGLSGVALIALVNVVGLQFQSQAQRTADESAKLETLMANVTEGFLEARQLATQFLQKRDEKLVEQ